MEQTSDTTTISRRKFLKAAGLTGTALFLGFYLPAGAKEGKIVNPDDSENREIEMNAGLLLVSRAK